jgi:hypothetical protein
MTFEEYLQSKRIDSHKFKAAEPDRWEEWRSLFEALSPSSFTSQKLYLINGVRRKYLLQTPDSTKARPAVSPPPKPVIKPKIN